MDAVENLEDDVIEILGVLILLVIGITIAAGIYAWTNIKDSDDWRPDVLFSEFLNEMANILGKIPGVGNGLAKGFVTWYGTIGWPIVDSLPFLSKIKPPETESRSGSIPDAVVNAGTGDVSEYSEDDSTGSSEEEEDDK